MANSCSSPVTSSHLRAQQIPARRAIPIPPDSLLRQARARGEDVLRQVAVQHLARCTFCPQKLRLARQPVSDRLIPISGCLAGPAAEYATLPAVSVPQKLFVLEGSQQSFETTPRGVRRPSM